MLLGEGEVDVGTGVLDGGFLESFGDRRRTTEISLMQDEDCFISKPTLSETMK